MSYTRKIMRLDLSAEKLTLGGYYYTELLLPAENYEIRDAMQKLRAVDREDSVLVKVLECSLLPELENVRLDSPTLDELNFFAKRLVSMTNEERIVFDIVIGQVIPEDTADELVSIKELINSTYGLDGERGEIYDGRTLPESEETESFVFRLIIGKYPTPKKAAGTQWVVLPTDIEVIRNLTIKYHEPSIDSYFCHAFESSISQITPEMIGDLLDYDKLYMLNKLAWHFELLSPMDQVKYKAVLAAEKPKDIARALDISYHLWKYYFYDKPENSEQFFRAYLSHHLDSRFDRKWLEALPPQCEGEKLLKRLGASVTDYGVISARGRSLYELVSYSEPDIKEPTTQAMADHEITETNMNKGMEDMQL